jgi:hypothetical protein
VMLNASVESNDNNNSMQSTYPTVHQLPEECNSVLTRRDFSPWVLINLIGSSECNHLRLNIATLFNLPA